MVRQVNFLIVIILVFLCTVVFGQDEKTDAEKDKKLQDEILAVYKSDGEEGLRDFVKDKKDSIGNKFIIEFAKSGVKERKEEWLKACEIMAKEKKDKKTIADVYYNIGEYLRLISENEKALGYLEKALVIYVRLKDIVGQGNVYLRNGIIHFYTSKNSNALGMYEKALSFFKKARDRLSQANVYLNKGEFYFYTGDRSEALKMYDQAMPLYEEERNLMGQGNVYKSKGYLYFISGDNSKALNMYNQALHFFEEIGDPLGLGNVFRLKGEIYFRTGSNAEAIEMYDKALPFFEKAGDLLDQGNVYSSKGDIYLHIGDNGKALVMYNKALSFFKKIGEMRGQGSVYKRKGDIYLHNANYFRAREMYDKAMPFYEKVGAPLGLGNLYLSLGMVYYHTGENVKAIEMCEKSLPFFKKLDNLVGLGNAHRIKGEIYKQIGTDDMALEMFKIALLLYEKAGDTIRIGDIYMEQGIINLNNNNTETAREMLENARQSYVKADSAIGLANVHKNMGRFFLINRDYSKAKEMFEKALVFYKKLGNMVGVGNILASKGDIYLLTGEYSKALVMYKNALHHFIKCGEIKSESFALIRIAIILVIQGKKGDAAVYFEQGISRLEKIREQAAFPQFKKSFFQQTYEEYEIAALLTISNRDYNKVFKYVELLKASIFLDQFVNGQLKLEKRIEPELKRKKDRLISKLSTLERNIYQYSEKNDKKKREELKNEIRKSEMELNELLVKIRLQCPHYASVRYPAAVAVENLQNNILKQGELLLDYFVTREKTYVFLVSKKKLKVVTLEIEEEDINRIVNIYLLAAKSNNEEMLIKYGKKLYQSILKPLETEIKGERNLLIAPDVDLAKVPFESFVIASRDSGKPVYLLEKYNTKYIQSASFLFTLRKYYNIDRQTNHFVGFGDPVYDYENFRKGLPEKGTHNRDTGNAIEKIQPGNYLWKDEVLIRLPESGEEVKAIAGLFKKHKQKSVVYLREQATEGNAKLPDLKEFDYIHFSCHGILEDRFQSLVLSQIPGAKEDGYLTLNDIMNCNYNAKLVLLSACETGTGKVERGEGVKCLTRAVIYAGTPAVVASLWKVRDNATKELLVKFYTYMIEKGKSKEEALRKAKLDMIKSKEYSSPYFWSAFVLYGE